MFSFQKNSLRVIFRFIQECTLGMLLVLCFVLSIFAQEAENSKDVVQNQTTTSFFSNKIVRESTFFPPSVVRLNSRVKVRSTFFLNS